MRHGYNAHVVCYYATMADEAARDGFACGLQYWGMKWDAEDSHFTLYDDDGNVID